MRLWVRHSMYRPWFHTYTLIIDYCAMTRLWVCKRKLTLPRFQRP